MNADPGSFVCAHLHFRLSIYGRVVEGMAPVEKHKHPSPLPSDTVLFLVDPEVFPVGHALIISLSSKHPDDLTSSIWLLSIQRSRCSILSSSQKLLLNIFVYFLECKGKMLIDYYTFSICKTKLEPFSVGQCKCNCFNWFNIKHYVWSNLVWQSGSSDLT